MEAPGEAAIRIHLRQQTSSRPQNQSQRKDINISLPFLKKKASTAIGRHFYPTAGYHDRSQDYLWSNPWKFFLHSRKITSSKYYPGNQRRCGGRFYLCRSLKKHPQPINELYTNLVVAGEEGGS